MFRMLSASLLLLVFTVVICCVLYPAAVWGIGQVFFPFQANGSMLKADGTATTKAEDAVGSLLIAQPFTKDEFFQPRPSACSYDASASRIVRFGGFELHHCVIVLPRPWTDCDVQKWFQCW